MEHLLPFSLPPHRRGRTKDSGGQIDLAHFGSNRLSQPVVADVVAMQPIFLLNDENQRVKAKYNQALNLGSVNTSGLGFTSFNTYTNCDDKISSAASIQSYCAI